MAVAELFLTAKKAFNEDFRTFLRATTAF